MTKDCRLPGANKTEVAVVNKPITNKMLPVGYSFCAYLKPIQIAYTTESAANVLNAICFVNKMLANITVVPVSATLSNETELICSGSMS
jgi:hypothetical protein